MRVQTFGSEFAVERLDEGVVSGLARSGEVERDAALISLEVEVAGDKLCALIDPDCFRETNLPADLFEYLNNIRAAKVEPSFDRRREARERVNDRKHPQLAPSGKLIMNEVHRPGLVRSCGRLPVLAQLCLNPALRRLVP